ncbi:alpha/beta-hydrolase [Sporormia fimetaria CBS 119925]|uniref:Carboxylic ester hydrolase n=1 Tax=Sporormia fimetaria CBS 119925 TaxID=1340428 RepID=A0A6A6V8D6_9PLEO|nr:alpha/beta-hydrolase [Sporormia fimetaria CBS 119925]
MIGRTLSILQTLLFLSYEAAAAPHVNDIGPATILTDNDLAGNPTKRTGGALLLEPSTYALASKRCAELNEQLWAPKISNFNTGLNSSLSYQAYLDHGNDLYWISSPSFGNQCNAITNKGHLRTVSCDNVIPALCTQSAPITQAGQADTSTKYQITVESGKQNLTGYRDFHTFRFSGIRFAPQPKRFEYSSLYEGSGDVDATKHGPGCLQPIEERWPVVSEDCLFLNIWTPYLPGKTPSRRHKKKSKAVLVWIYGGGFTAGTGTDPEKEGGSLASRGDIVVVTFNYRVGNLGFLPFNDGVHNGNYGISDMATALRWVKKHIADFGGDPDRVTIWGESAGASGVRALLSAPSMKNYISGAIMQSLAGEFGNAGLASYYQDPDEAHEKTTKAILKESNCEGVTDELACMRAYDPLEWSKAGRTAQAQWPTRDGDLLPYRGLPLSGPLAYHHNIPILIGTNRDEFTYQVPFGSTNFTEMLGLLSQSLAVNVSHLSDSSFAPDKSPEWPSLSETEKAKAVQNATGHVLSAGVFTCPTLAFTYSATKHKIFNPVYQFEFNRTYQPARFTGDARQMCGRDLDDPDHTEYYKCHAGELPYTFGNILQQGWKDRDGLDTAFARLVVDYWTAFVRTGRVEPEKGYLEARGWLESKRKMEDAGVWKTSEKGVMNMHWGELGMMRMRDEEKGCEELGLGRDWYESLEFGGK